MGTASSRPNRKGIRRLAQSDNDRRLRVLKNGNPALNILVFDDAQATAQRAAALIACRARNAITERGQACIALSGGRTPWKMIRALATENLSWSKVHIFQTDERVVPPTDRERTFLHLREALLLAPLRPEHVHAMTVDENDLATPT